ncbi:MAG TPA: pseudouridine synthase [Bacteroidales bacterium]|nr:pseudouridine synthase [Bacteroidales bacterium]
MTDPEIIYQDAALIVVNKPVDLPIHKNDHMPHDAPYLTKWIGQKLNATVWNVHRLDAKTSGIVVLAFNKNTAHALTQQFEKREVAKKYLAIVREFPGEEGTFDKPVKKNKKGKLVKALTHFKTLQTVQTNITYRTFENIRLSLIELEPETGRWHQLRQHLALERNDIIGDNQHGDRMLNHIIEDITGEKRLYLHASEISFTHPESGELLSFEAEMPEEFGKLMGEFG